MKSLKMNAGPRNFKNNRRFSPRLGEDENAVSHGMQFKPPCTEREKSSAVARFNNLDQSAESQRFSWTACLGPFFRQIEIRRFRGTLLDDRHELCL
jgi:hypothetical protein